MSVLNKTLKAIEHRHDSVDLGLEPTVTLSQNRGIAPRLLHVLAAVLALALIVAAYFLIPTRQLEPTPAATLVAEPQQAQTQQAQTPPEPVPLSSPHPRQGAAEAADKTRDKTTEAELPPAAVPSPGVEPGSKAAEWPEQGTPVQLASTSSNARPALAAGQALPGDASQAAVQAQAKKPVVIKSLSPQQRAERWFVQGQQSLNYGMMDEAIGQFEQVLSIFPEHQQARTLLAATLYGQSRVEDAYALLIKGLERQPAMLKWRVLIAKMATEQQQFARVLAVLDQPQDALALQEDNNDYWILKGTAARQLQQEQIARDCFTLLVQRQPNVAKWWLALAGSEEALGAPERAKAHYGKALELGGLSLAAQEYARTRYTSLQGIQ